MSACFACYTPAHSRFGVCASRYTSGTGTPRAHMQGRAGTMWIRGKRYIMEMVWKDVELEGRRLLWWSLVLRWRRLYIIMNELLGIVSCRFIQRVRAATADSNEAAGLLNMIRSGSTRLGILYRALLQIGYGDREFWGRMGAVQQQLGDR